MEKQIVDGVLTITYTVYRSLEDLQNEYEMRAGELRRLEEEVDSLKQELKDLEKDIKELRKK